MTKAILFDLTGVLLEFKKDRLYSELRKINDEFFQVDFENFKKAYFRAYSYYQVGLLKNDLQFFNKVCDELSVKLDKKTLAEVADIHLNCREKFVKLAKNAESVLEYLNRKYVLGVVSNSVYNWVKYDFEMLNFDFKKYFKAFVTSQKYHFLKPNPRLYLIALKKLKIHPSETAYIDDEILNLNGAYFAGINDLILLKKKKKLSHYHESLKTRPIREITKIFSLSELKTLF